MFTVLESATTYSGLTNETSSETIYFGEDVETLGTEKKIKTGLKKYEKMIDKANDIFLKSIASKTPSFDRVTIKEETNNVFPESIATEIVEDKSVSTVRTVGLSDDEFKKSLATYYETSSPETLCYKTVHSILSKFEELTISMNMVDNNLSETDKKLLECKKVIEMLNKNKDILLGEKADFEVKKSSLKDTSIGLIENAIDTDKRVKEINETLVEFKSPFSKVEV